MKVRRCSGPRCRRVRRSRTDAPVPALFAAMLALALVLAVPAAVFAEDGDEAATAQPTSSASSASSASSPVASASAQATASPESTSNKPETSPSPSSESTVNDSPDNVVNTAQLPDNSFLYDASIAALIEADSFYDGQTVQLTGEVVGDCIVEPLDRTHCWITLASTDADVVDTLSVYLSADLCSAIDGYGRYGVTGTTVQLRGTFNVACTEHEGATDIHAESLTALKPSSSHPDAFVWGDFVPGIVLLVLGLAGLFLFRVVRERRR